MQASTGDFTSLPEVNVEMDLTQTPAAAIYPALIYMFPFKSTKNFMSSAIRPGKTPIQSGSRIAQRQRNLGGQLNMSWKQRRRKSDLAIGYQITDGQQGEMC